MEIEDYMIKIHKYSAPAAFFCDSVTIILTFIIIIIIKIMSEVDVKLNKWHIAMEKSYRKPTKTEHNLKKNYARQWD